MQTHPPTPLLKKSESQEITSNFFFGFRHPPNLRDIQDGNTWDIMSSFSNRISCGVRLDAKPDAKTDLESGGAGEYPACKSTCLLQLLCQEDGVLTYPGKPDEEADGVSPAGWINYRDLERKEPGRCVNPLQALLCIAASCWASTCWSFAFSSTWPCPPKSAKIPRVD